MLYEHIGTNLGVILSFSLLSAIFFSIEASLKPAYDIVFLIHSKNPWVLMTIEMGVSFAK